MNHIVHSMPFSYLKKIAPIEALTTNQHHFFEMHSFQRKGTCRASAFVFKCPPSNAASNQVLPFKHTTSLVLHYTCKILQWKQLNTTNVCFISTLRYSEILILLAPVDLRMNSKFQLNKVRGTN